jgi:hypothetical protein
MFEEKQLKKLSFKVKFQQRKKKKLKIKNKKNPLFSKEGIK